jgi:hypothetical protein
MDFYRQRVVNMNSLVQMPVSMRCLLQQPLGPLARLFLGLVAQLDVDPGLGILVFVELIGRGKDHAVLPKNFLRIIL